MNDSLNEGSAFGQVFRGGWGSPGQDGQEVLGVPGLAGLNRPTLAAANQLHLCLLAPLTHRSTTAPQIPSHRRSRLNQPPHAPPRPGKRPDQTESQKHNTPPRVVHPPSEPTHLLNRNVGIMRFLFVDTASPQVFVADVDTIGLSPLGVAQELVCSEPRRVHLRLIRAR